MRVLRAPLALVLCALIIAAGSGRAAGQGRTIDWSPANNLSNTPASSNRPAIVADAAGNVHVIWGEDIGGESVLGIPGGLIGTANSLVYTRWDGETWSDPIDVIALPTDNIAEYASLAIDSKGFLHLVWTGLSTIYYSTALASEAVSPRSWTTPLVVGSSARTSWESTVAVDLQDTVHILYATRDIDPAVFHVTISAEGAVSPFSTRLSLPLQTPEEAAFLNLSLKVDPQSRLHALWGTVRTQGVGHAAYYTRSVNFGTTWSNTVRLAQGEEGVSNVEFPSLGFVGDSEIHLIYAYPQNMARTERISLNAGETWGELQTIYPDLEGIAGFNVQLTDASGNLHVLSNMRTHNQVEGVVYWGWLGDRWSPSQFANIETEFTGPGGHFTAATIRLGNEIHVLWNTNLSNQAGEIWHVSGTIPNVPAQTPVPLPSPRAPVQISQTSDSQTPEVESVASLIGETQAPVSPAPGNVPSQSQDMTFTILLSMAPALLLVAGVVIWRFARKRQRRWYGSQE